MHKNKLKEVYIKCVAFTLIYLVYHLITPIAAFVRDSREFYRICGKYLVIRPIFSLTPIHLKVHGLENLPAGPIVIAANHRSLIDSLALLAILDRPFTIITEPFDAMPSGIIQQWVKQLGYLPVIRDEKDEKNHRIGMSRHNLVPLCTHKVHSGKSLVVYPEAHHEKRQGLLTFKTGALRIALGARVPLVPIAITGSDKVITPKYYHLHAGIITIRIGEPMQLHMYYGKEDERKLIRELTRRLRERIRHLIPGH